MSEALVRSLAIWLCGPMDQAPAGQSRTLTLRHTGSAGNRHSYLARETHRQIISLSHGRSSRRARDHVTMTFLGTRGEIDLRSRQHRHHSALMIQRGTARVMIDCGAPIGSICWTRYRRPRLCSRMPTPTTPRSCARRALPGVREGCDVGPAVAFSDPGPSYDRGARALESRWIWVRGGSAGAFHPCAGRRLSNCGAHAVPLLCPGRGRYPRSGDRAQRRWGPQFRSCIVWASLRRGRKSPTACASLRVR